MQTIIQTKGRSWGDFGAVFFLLALAAFFAWAAFGFGLYERHGEVGFVPLGFSILFALGSLLFVKVIRHPRQKLLAIDCGHLVWRITDEKSGRTVTEMRLHLGSIRALKWIARKPAWRLGSSQPANLPRLVFVTSNGRGHELPGEFFAAVHRRRIEATLKGSIPSIQILDATE